MRSKRLALLPGVLLLLTGTVSLFAAAADPKSDVICAGAPPLELNCPSVMLIGIPFNCEIVPTGDLGEGAIEVDVLGADGAIRAQATLRTGGSASNLGS